MTLKQINQYIRIGWYAVILIVILAITCSCGTRKTSTEKVKEVQKIETSETITEKETTEIKVDTNIKEVTETKIDKENNIVTETKTIKPIDATKKSNYKGIEFENAEINETKTTDLSKEKFVSIEEYNKAVYLTGKSVKMLNQLFKENKELKAKLNSKQTERKSSYWWLLWLLLIIPIYYFYRKYLVGRF